MLTEFIEIHNNYKNALDRAKEILSQGGLFVFPTDTVYGLGCIYNNEDSVRKIYEIKGRDFQKPLVAYFSSIQMAEKYIKPQNQMFYDLSQKYLPGELTIIVNKNDLIPDFVTSNQNTLGIRIPRNDFIINLIEILGVPFVGTSANISNYPSAKTAKDAYDIFNGKIELVLEDDKSHKGLESTVLSIVNDEIKILRPGAIAIDL